MSKPNKTDNFQNYELGVTNARPTESMTGNSAYTKLMEKKPTCGGGVSTSCF